MGKATIFTALCYLCCISLLACGEVGKDEIPSFSSNGNNANSSSSNGENSSNSNVLDINWKIPEEDSKVHGDLVVYVDKYRISEKLITQRQYKAVMNENPAKNKNDDLPIEGVTWFKAVDFCKKLSLSMGLNENAIRLPTEAEWEIATYKPVIQRNDDYWEWTNDCFDSQFPWEKDNPSGPPNCLLADGKVRKGLSRNIEDRFLTDPYSTDISGGYISFRVVIREEDFIK